MEEVKEDERKMENRGRGGKNERKREDKWNEKFRKSVRKNRQKRQKRKKDGVREEK